MPAHPVPAVVARPAYNYLWLARQFPKYAELAMPTVPLQRLLELDQLCTPGAAAEMAILMDSATRREEVNAAITAMRVAMKARQMEEEQRTGGPVALADIYASMNTDPAAREATQQHLINVTAAGMSGPSVLPLSKAAAKPSQLPAPRHRPRERPAPHAQPRR